MIHPANELNNLLDNLQNSVKPKTVHCEKSEKHYKQNTNVDQNESNDDVNENNNSSLLFFSNLILFF